MFLYFEVLRLPTETSGRYLHFGSGHLAQSRFSANLFVASVRKLVISTPSHFYVISGLCPEPDLYQEIDLDLKFLDLASNPENLGSRPRSCQILRKTTKSNVIIVNPAVMEGSKRETGTEIGAKKQ